MSAGDTPEFRFFRAALRCALGTADSSGVARAAPAVSEWRAIRFGALRHNLGPLILPVMEDLGEGPVPHRILAALRKQTSRARMRDLGQVAALERLAPAFADAGIRVLTLKGVALSVQFGATAPRGALDIDLLVDPGQFDQARAVLLAAGYQALHPDRSPRQTQIHRVLYKDEEFVHPINGTVIELHTRLFGNPELLFIDFDTLWANREVVAVGEANIATLGRPHLTLYLFVHGAVHGWMRMQWLVDLAQAFRTPGLLGETRATAEKAGLGSAFHVALILLRDWLNFPIPQGEMATVRGDIRARCQHWLVSKFYTGSAWRETPADTSWRGFLRSSVWNRLHQLLLKPGGRYVFGQFKRDLVVPADWDAIRLPDFLFFLYPLLRPFGWLVRRWRGRGSPDQPGKWPPSVE